MNHMPKQFDRYFDRYVMTANDIYDQPSIAEAIEANVVKLELACPITGKHNTDSWKYYDKNTGKPICNTTATHRIGDSYHSETKPRWIEACEVISNDV